MRRWQSAALVERSLPEIERLASLGQYVDAYRLGQRAASVAPGDPRVQRAIGAATVPFNMTNQPARTCISRTTATSMVHGCLLGRVPIKGARVPHGRAAVATRQGRIRHGRRRFARSARLLRFVEPERRQPEWFTCAEDRLATGTTTFQLPDFWMDRYEVTNREFKRFVDAGGYRERKYWKESFDLAERLRDKTGRPGPATWELGTFPEGQADYPVSGVSWYEAAAYAEFAGKRLPTVFHWRQRDRDRVIRPGGCGRGEFQRQVDRTRSPAQGSRHLRHLRPRRATSRSGSGMRPTIGATSSAARGTTHRTWR